MKRISILCVMAALSVGAVSAAQQTDDAQVRARQRIAKFEGALETAVKFGADGLLRRVRAVTPDPPMLTGEPEVRGFPLDGYGVFFDVEVPALRLPVTWPLRYMTRDTRNLETLAAEARALSAQASRLDAEFQRQFLQFVRRLEAQAQGPQTMRGTVGALSSAQLGVGIPSESASPRTPTVDPRVLDNPNAAYTGAVKDALIDAIIEDSGALTLGPDEWLTVAARDNLPRDPLVPGDSVDFSTLIFRIKGSDLTAFRAGRLTMEEARAKVDVREY
ncbi:MAG TPA: hypothetical protein VFO58_09200 [Vicinamibacterales bacterium]|nr:hypothetical protein [Vicinamibacterales bacterium]